LSGKIRRFTSAAKFGGAKMKGEEAKQNRNHGEAIGACNPATRTRSAKIGVIAGGVRSPRPVVDSNRHSVF